MYVVLTQLIPIHQYVKKLSHISPTSQMSVCMWAVELTSGHCCMVHCCMVFMVIAGMLEEPLKFVGAIYDNINSI